MAYPTNPTSAVDILARLPSSFNAAHSSGDLFFYESEAHDVYAGDKRFSIRVCPALGQKAASTSTSGKTNGGGDDETEGVTGSEEGARGVKRVRTESDKAGSPSPFRPPYVPNLYVGCLTGVDGEDDMAVLLNKYSILKEHFLLCPTTEQPQSLPPTPAQLAVVHSLLVAGTRATPARRLMAFYNGGEGAGASQRWRHVQFIDTAPGSSPLDEWCRSLTFDRPDRAIVHPTLPYLHIIHPLPAFHAVPFPPTEDTLTQLADVLAPALMRLLDIAFDALRRSGGERSQGWNLIMTLDHLHLIPRSAPVFSLASGGVLELNALGYAGMLLVRSSEQEAALLDTVAHEPTGLVKVLEKCAVPKSFGVQALEAEEVFLGSVANGLDV